MKLTQRAIDEIKRKSLYPHLAIALNVSVGSIYRYVAANSDELTKAAALEVIHEKTGLSQEEILEREQEAA